MYFGAKHQKSLRLFCCEYSDTMVRSQVYHLFSGSNSNCKHLKALYIV